MTITIRSSSDTVSPATNINASSTIARAASPRCTELGIFSVMWSEHCSYKSSRVHLKTLPTTGKRVLQGPGENAGAVDIGDGLAAVFKIESHNHPSFIEPVPGRGDGRRRHHPRHLHDGRAADCAAELAALRIARRSARAADDAGVVAGIAGYGNSIGIPTVGGEIALRRELYAATRSSTSSASASPRPTRSSRAPRRESGTPSTTSAPRPAATASTARRWRLPSSTTSRPRRRPAVQVGDPFMEKLLLEACLEVMETDALCRHSRHGRGRPDVLDLRDGRARRRRRRDRCRARAAA